MEIQEIGYKDEYDNPQKAVVGQYVLKITCHPAQGEGDKYFYEIHRGDGSITTVFNPIRVLTTKI
jgi:hypothetical protein